MLIHFLTSYLGVACLLFLSMFLLYNCRMLYKVIDKQNLKIINHYLSNQFIKQSLKMSVNTADTTKFLQAIADKIKSYYHLDDLVILTMGDDILCYGIGEAKSAQVTKAFYEKLKTLPKDYFQEYKLQKIMINDQERDRNLYVSRINLSQGKDRFILCVEPSPSLISGFDSINLEFVLYVLHSRLTNRKETGCSNAKSLA